jgi:threonine/homoserine/homoserine lactone efflux protein
VHDTARILLYGLIAAASPTTVLAVLVVLLSRRGRANGTAFAAGFLFGSVAAFLTAFFVGSTISNQHHGSVRSYVELALGVVLIAVAWRARRPREPTEADGRSGMEALFERLEHVRPPVSFSLGVALGVGTKRLVITAVAATTVAFAGLSDAEEAGLGVLYVVVAGLAVWLLVAIYLITGKRADDWIANAKAWLTTNTQKVVYYSSTAFGIAIIGDALIQLL